MKRAKTKKKVESGNGESGKPLSKGEKLSQREVKKEIQTAKSESWSPKRA